MIYFVVQCHALSNPANGGVNTTGHGTEVGNTATYFCNDGYDLIGDDNVIFCQSEGIWSGSPPICEG